MLERCNVVVVAQFVCAQNGTKGLLEPGQGVAGREQTRGMSRATRAAWCTPSSAAESTCTWAAPAATYVRGPQSTGTMCATGGLHLGSIGPSATSWSPTGPSSSWLMSRMRRLGRGWRPNSGAHWIVLTGGIDL